MKNFVAAILLLIFIGSACKHKPKASSGKKFISVVSLIEKQVAHVDTSLYSIQKITIYDSTHSDTTYIRREDFRAAAKEFLEVPDLSNPEVAENFTEESRYDSLIKKVIITYVPVDPKKSEIQKQEMLVSTITGEDGNNKVTNLIIDRVKSTRDSSVIQKMLWQMDKSFLITSTTQKPNEPEKTVTEKVVWNDN